MNLWAVFMYFCVTIHALLELCATMAVIYTVVKVGGGQAKVLQLIHLRLNINLQFFP